MKGYTFGPKLYRIFRWRDSLLRRRVGGRDYEPNTLEWVCDTFINSVSYAITFSCYCSPMIAYYIYQKGLFTGSHGQVVYCLKLLIAVNVGMVSAFLIRGYGRSMNPDYTTFLKVLTEANKNRYDREDLQLFDFDFHLWPRDFLWNESSIKSNVTYEDLRDKTSISDVLTWPSQLLQYILMHGLGRPMAYPGSVKLLQLAMSNAILEGRTSLIEKNGLRAKLVTEDDNEIDTMFMDRRSDENNGIGNSLIICCEGNAACYELGCMGTPMKAGYSTLGWNHPGFFGSTGLPNAETEKNAIDVVIRYAVTRLGFPLEDIIMFAWSIGGYTASYAGMMYPNIKGVILDATFDQITQLALHRMPGFAEGIVKKIVKNYLDLDVVRHCLNYPGPIRLIRRQRDELISIEPGNPQTNRANHLLLSILKYRYPNIFTQDSEDIIWNFLSVHEPSTVIDQIGGIDHKACESRLAIEEDRPNYPLDIGLEWSTKARTETALYLSLMYMDHFDATHCMPLPSMYLKLPWQHKNKKTLKLE